MSDEQAMTDDRSDLTELAATMFSRAEGSRADAGTGPDAAVWDAALWDDLERTGLARLSLTERLGGSGGTLLDLAAVLMEAGAHGARVPLVETDLLGGWLAGAAGLGMPAGPLTAVAGELDVELTGDGRATVSGTLHRVPWARTAAAVVVLTGEHVVVLEPAGMAVTEGTNVAEEPRDTVTVAQAGVAVGPAPTGTADELALRAALGRSLLMAGAARGALARSVRYAGERIQFGRPIARFQAVQQQLALAAAEVAAVAAAADAAAGAAHADGFGAASTAFAVAAAKARAGEAATAVARIAHQVHGAIGFTREHDLRLLTTRLWAWRDEDGSDAHWAGRLGDTVLAAGPDGLWPLITS